MPRDALGSDPLEGVEFRGEPGIDPVRPEASTQSPQKQIAVLVAISKDDEIWIDGEQVDAGFKKAAGNLPGINVLPAIGANVYDILNHDTLVLTKDAVAKLEARFNG